MNLLHEAELRINLRTIKKIEEIRISSIAMVQDFLMFVFVLMQTNALHGAELGIKFWTIKKIEEIRTIIIAIMQDDLMYFDVLLM